MKPGDLVLIRFPQADLMSGKLRPALVVAVAPGAYPDLLLALITSRTHQAIAAFDEIVDRADSDFPRTRLKTPSAIRLSRLATVESTVVTARLGSISSERLMRVRRRLVEWLSR